MRRDEQNDLRPTSFGQQIPHPSRSQVGPSIYKGHAQTSWNRAKGGSFWRAGMRFIDSEQETDRPNSTNCEFIS